VLPPRTSTVGKRGCEDVNILLSARHGAFLAPPGVAGVPVGDYDGTARQLLPGMEVAVTGAGEPPF